MHDLYQITTKSLSWASPVLETFEPVLFKYIVRAEAMVVPAVSISELPIATSASAEVLSDAEVPILIDAVLAAGLRARRLEEEILPRGED